LTLDLKNRRLTTIPQERCRGSLERHFALVRTIQAEKMVQICIF